jgi:hypothetical protein
MPEDFKPMDYIDGIFYINLEKRLDRRVEIEIELTNMELPFERFPAIETPGRGILGCGLSHLSVFKLAKERKFRNVLIFEDDFYFLISKTELYDRSNFNENLTIALGIQPVFGNKKLLKDKNTLEERKTILKNTYNFNNISKFNNNTIHSIYKILEYDKIFLIF